MAKYRLLYENYFYKYRRSQIKGFLLLSIYLISSIIYPYFLKIIIDNSIINNDYKSLLQNTLLMTIVLCVMIFTRYMKSLYYLTLGQKIGLDLKKHILNKVFNNNLQFFKNIKIGDIVSILDQDVASIQRLFVNIINDFIANILTFIGLCVIVVLLNWKIALISLFVSTIYLLIQKKYSSFIKQMAYIYNRERGSFLDLTQRILEKIVPINLLNKKSYFIEKYQDNFKDLSMIEKKGVGYREYLFVIDGFFEAINLILVLFIGGIMVLKNELTIGSLFTLSLYVQKLFTPIVSCINNYIEMKKTEASIERVLEILETSNYELKSGNYNFNSLNNFDITIKDLNFSYNERHLLKNIDLKINEGEKVVLVGDNGTGKSTLLNILTRLEPFYNGHITIDDVDINSFDSDSFFNNVLYIGQVPFIFNGTIIENIVINNKNIDNASIMKAITFANLDKDIEQMADGINTIVGNYGVKLSAGQCQKISLARLFLRKDIPIIILDEPTSALDTKSEEIILQNIFRKFNESTVIFVSHRDKVLDYCNYKLKIENNRILKEKLCVRELSYR
ncbi:MAG: ABC transporter ATP-binding protein/permease [Clostridiaceae bacterium]|nr:ABC transporter ATP-binding protein/permease [Clostridiaceae bacterium]MBW4859509.1 ABC transporter ATP-binding protein/permease [Clostridiaceae bacterium]MBW4867354.1 ABC transporter ATP-binding protein/permease [Clostridiaceae bacterium]